MTFFTAEPTMCTPDISWTFISLSMSDESSSLPKFDAMRMKYVWTNSMMSFNAWPIVSPISLFMKTNRIRVLISWSGKTDITFSTVFLYISSTIRMIWLNVFRPYLRIDSNVDGSMVGFWRIKVVDCWMDGRLHFVRTYPVVKYGYPKVEPLYVSGQLYVRGLGLGGGDVIGCLKSNIVFFWVIIEFWEGTVSIVEVLEVIGLAIWIFFKF